MTDEKAFGLVIFDCDGVLVDSEIISCGTIARLLTEFGVPCDFPQALDRYLGRPAQAVIDGYQKAKGQPLPAEFMRKWRTQLFDAFDESLEAIPGVRKAIESLPVPICLASSSDAERIERCLRKTGLWDIFEGRAFNTGMVVNGKPAPDIFLYAAGAMRVHPADCLVIEDSPSGIKAAKTAGMTAWGFTGGRHYTVPEQTERLLAAGADRILTGMDMLRVAA